MSLRDRQPAIYSRISRGRLGRVGSCGEVGCWLLLSIGSETGVVFALPWKSRVEMDDLRYGGTLERG
jgi:hypothetical protein